MDKIIQSLGQNEVHLWSLMLPINLEEVILPDMDVDNLLDIADVEKYLNFRVKNKKMELLISRIFLWEILEKYVVENKKQMRLSRDNYGKPFLFSGMQKVFLYFNLSHTSGMMCCAVSRNHPLGVDVEDASREIKYDFRDYLSTEEKASLANIYLNRGNYIYCLWTLKEAFLKADGRGLSLPLDSFGFSIKNETEIENGIEIHFSNSFEKKWHGKWHFRLFKPTTHHVLSVAVQMEAVPQFVHQLLNLQDLSHFKSSFPQV